MLLHLNKKKNMSQTVPGQRRMGDCWSRPELNFQIVDKSTLSHPKP